MQISGVRVERVRNLPHGFQAVYEKPPDGEAVLWITTDQTERDAARWIAHLTVTTTSR